MKDKALTFALIVIVLCMVANTVYYIVTGS
jgi:uncharacterized membrane protein